MNTISIHPLSSGGCRTIVVDGASVRISRELSGGQEARNPIVIGARDTHFVLEAIARAKRANPRAPRRVGQIERGEDGTRWIVMTALNPVALMFVLESHTGEPLRGHAKIIGEELDALERGLRIAIGAGS